MNLVAGAEPALTIYNQNFAVVRDIVPLELNAGSNRIQYEGATVYVEPDSVTLRDPSGKIPIRILEQSYRADPVSMRALLSQYEGRSIDFVVRSGDRTEVVTGKVIRVGSGVLLPSIQNGWAPYQPPQSEQA